MFRRFKSCLVFHKDLDSRLLHTFHFMYTLEIEYGYPKSIKIILICFFPHCFHRFPKHCMFWLSIGMPWTLCQARQVLRENGLPVPPEWFGVPVQPIFVGRGQEEKGGNFSHFFFGEIGKKNIFGNQCEVALHVVFSEMMFVMKDNTLRNTCFIFNVPLQVSSCQFETRFVVAQTFHVQNHPLWDFTNPTSYIWYSPM